MRKGRKNSKNVEISRKNERSKSKNTENLVESKVDRLSDIPFDILNLILKKLQLREAIRTSILSKQWRYKWIFLSEFTLDLDKKHEDAMSTVVFRYLRKYQDSTVSKFELSGINSSSVRLQRFCNWISDLSSKGVKELILKCNIDNRIYHVRFELPPLLFDLKELRYLELKTCIVEVPTTFEGFSHLTSLVLSSVFVFGDGLENLIKKCRSLTSLKLCNVSEENLRICGTNLKHVEFDWSFKNIWFEKTTSLASIDFVLDRYDDDLGKCNLLIVDGVLSNLERLSLSIESFLEFNNVDGIDLSHVSTLNLYGLVNLNQADEVKHLLSLLRKCPNLKNLTFSVRLDGEGAEGLNYMKETKPLSLTRLQSVIVDYTSPIRVLEEFLHLITGNSPLFKTLEITKLVEQDDYVSEDWKTARFQKKFTKVFHRLKEVSPEAKIIIHKAIHDRRL